MDQIESEIASLNPHVSVTRRGFILTSLGSGFAAAVLPVSAQTITTDSAGLIAGEVKIPVSDGQIPAYRAQPAGGHNLPTVLVVQEIFGVHEHIKDLCRRLAKEGYLAIAAALYARQGDPAKYASIPELRSNIVSKVPDAEVMSDLDATAAWAAKHGGDPKRLVVTGFCWGGGVTWLYCAHNPNLKAGVAWYGPLVGDADALHPTHPVGITSALKAPVLGLYGGLDQGITAEHVAKMRAALHDARGAAADSTIIVYADAPHGFNADYRPSYMRADAQDGWAKMLAWFRKSGA